MGDIDRLAPPARKSSLKLVVTEMEKKERPVSLKDWQNMFKKIYTRKDKRDYTESDLLLHIQEEAALIDEGLRKIDENGRQEIINALPKFFCWLLSFCNMAGIDLETVISGKYSGCCPYCGREKNCMCITGDVKPSQWHALDARKIPCNLPEWQIMFFDIYGKINKISPLIHIWLHVHEELGEFSREWRLGNRSEAFDEMADSFAWLMAFCNKLGVNLGDLTWEAYPRACNVCKKKECQCPKV